MDGGGWEGGRAVGWLLQQGARERGGERWHGPTSAQLAWLPAAGSPCRLTFIRDAARLRRRRAATSRRTCKPR